jgi:hypothetical protein
VLLQRTFIGAPPVQAARISAILLHQTGPECIVGNPDRAPLFSPMSGLPVPTEVQKLGIPLAFEPRRRISASLPDV